MVKYSYPETCPWQTAFDRHDAVQMYEPMLTEECGGEVPCVMSYVDKCLGLTVAQTVLTPPVPGKSMPSTRILGRSYFFFAE